MRLLRASGLPADKTFRNFDLKRLPTSLQLPVERLKSGNFLQSATNVVAVGRPGVGKTQPTHYPDRPDHVTLRRDGDRGRSTTPTFWENAPLSWHRQFLSAWPV